MNKTNIAIFLHKLQRVSVLDSSVYQDTRKSFLSAIAIVLLVAFSHGVAGVIRAKLNHWNPVESFIVGIQGEIFFWLTQSLLYYAVAKWVLKKSVHPKEIFSAVGYAIFPGILIVIAALLQSIEMSVPFLIILAVYRLATCTIALRQILMLKSFTAMVIVIMGSVIGFTSLGFGIRLTEALLK